MLLYKIFCWYLTLLGVQNVIEAVITTPVACSLNLSHSSLSKQSEERIEDKGSLRLVRYHFNIKNDTGPFSAANVGELFLINPYSSVLAIDGAAKSLLHLKEYFIEMSLYTLNFSVAEYQVKLEQWPTNCLENVSATDLEIELKLLIFRNFGASRSSAITLEGEVCNQYMKVFDDHSNFVSFDDTIGVPTYDCCRLDGEGQLFCNDLETSFSADIIFAAIIILRLVFFLYIPILLPTYGRKGEKYVNYIHKPTNKHKLRVVKINTNEMVLDDCFVKSDPFQSSALSSFKTTMHEQTENTLYNVDVKELHLFVKKTGIVADGEAPVTLFGFLNSFFFRCDTIEDLREMREGALLTTGSSLEKYDEDVLCVAQKIFEEYDLESCCTTSACPQVCGIYKHCNNNTNRCLWYQICALLMKLIICISITIPWWFRVWFYYRVEEGSMAQSKHILDKIGLNQQFDGSYVRFLTPLHPLFILSYILYLLYFLISCFICFRKADMWSGIISMLSKSLEDTIDVKRFNIFLKLLAFICFPIKKYGILCIFLFPLWFLPLLLFGGLLYIVNIFPLFSFTGRLLVNTIAYNIKNTCSFRLFIGLTWLLAMILLQFITECIGFYAECIIYLFIGIILNSNDTLNYLVLSLMIAIYAYQCFSSVGFRYQAFGQLLHKIIFKKLGSNEAKQIKQIAAEEKHKQKEHAFAVKHTNEADCKDGIHIKLTSTPSLSPYLKLNAERLLLFLDTDDIIHIPRKFLMKVANIDHTFCPGPVHLLYLSALIKLFWITLYLTFQFVVIAAFGRATNSSSFNQTMAEIGGGLLPYILTTYVMKEEHSQPSLEEIENNIIFEFNMNEIIENYEERWYLADLVLSDHLKDTEKNVNVNHKQDDIDLIVKPQVKVQANGEQDKQWEFWYNKKLLSATGDEVITNDPNVTDDTIKRTTCYTICLPGSTIQNTETEIHTSKKKK